jgi:hypothetical protein
MSKYVCPNCNKDFKQKINFINHTVKKKIPCKAIEILENKKSIDEDNNLTSSNFPPNYLQNEKSSSNFPPNYLQNEKSSSNFPPISENSSKIPPISLQNSTSSSKIPPISLQNSTNNFNNPQNVSNNEFINNLLNKLDENNVNILLKNENNHLSQSNNMNLCMYCEKKFSRNDNLQRHLNGRCKSKKYFENLENLKKKLHYLVDNFENNTESFINTMNNVQNNSQSVQPVQPVQNTNNVQNTQTTQNTNNGVINNGLVNNGSINGGNTINIVQFGKEDITKCNLIEMMGVYLKSTGGNIFSNILKYLNFNPKYPEHFNILMTDLSREIVKIHNGKKFISKKFKNVKGDILNVLNEHITNMCDTYIENPHTKKNEDIVSKMKINNISVKLINNDDIRPLLKNKNNQLSKTSEINQDDNSDFDSESDDDELDLEGEQKLIHYEKKRQGLQEIATQRLKDELYNNKDLVVMHHKILL